MTLQLSRTLLEEKKIIYPSPVQNGIVHIPNETPESCTVEQMECGIKLPFNPGSTRTMLDIKKFEDLDIDELRKRVSGLVLSVNGTLIGKGNTEFSPEVVEKLKEIRARMKVCVFPNSGEEHTLFYNLQIPIVKNAAPKPDPRGFERAAYYYLELKPQQCATVGSNLINESGARRIGMRVILVDPLKGSESIFYKMGRSYSRFVKSVHDKLYGRKK